MELFIEKDGIKIYQNLTQEQLNNYDSNIWKYRQRETKESDIFTPLKPSTLTAEGILSNISFHEQKLIKILPIPEGNILQIGCNFGELINKNYKKPEQKKKSNRGRKPKPKNNNKKRKVQGSGKFFSSQITFEIKHSSNDQQYKIKLFRTGKLQAPGIKTANMLDLLDPIKTLVQYLQAVFPKQIKLTSLKAVMRNYTCSLRNKNWFVKRNEFENLLRQLKNVNYQKEQFIKKIEPTFGNLSSYISQFITFNEMNIAEILNNCERYPSLQIKFRRPIPGSVFKKVTIKVLRSGKINFDGGNSEKEIEELYYWLQNCIYQHRHLIIYDVKNDDYVQSDCSDTSVYDGEYSEDDMWWHDEELL